MRKLTTILSIITVCIASAQYHPMLNNSSWIVHVYPFLGPDPYYETIHEGDQVMIGNETYTKIFDPVYGQDLYFREDIQSGKVYQLIDGIDTVAFDFGLKETDTITFANGIIYTVTSVTTVEVVGGTRKVMILDSVLGYEYWIEGIGSLTHPLVSHVNDSDPTVTLRCNYQNGVMVHSFSNFECANTLEVVENHSSNLKCAATPNPFSVNSSISLNKPLENAVLKMYNVLGEMVGEQIIDGTEIIIDRGNLKAGLYFIGIFEKGILRTVEKVMVSDYIHR